MSESRSTYTDTQESLQSQGNRLSGLRDELAELVEKLATVRSVKNEFTPQVAEQIGNKLISTRQALDGFECGILFINDLVVAIRLVAARPDHRSVQTIRFCLQNLIVYLGEVAGNKDSPFELLLAFNEIMALQKMPLLTENLFSVPDVFRVLAEKLRRDSSANNNANKTATVGYLESSQILLSIYRGDNREANLQQLAEQFTSYADDESDENIREFWVLCKTFAATVKPSPGELGLALFNVFKQIESVLLFVLGEKQSPVLGIQQKIDRLQVNLLCYTHTEEARGSHSAQQFGDVYDELITLQHTSLAEYTPWLQTSVSILADRLHHCVIQLAEEVVDTDDQLAALVEEIALLKRLLVVVGVHGARGNLEEVEAFLRKPDAKAHAPACSTSVQLVEQQLLFQFAFLKQSNEKDSAESKADTNSDAVGKAQLNRDLPDKSIDQATPEAPGSQISELQLASELKESQPSLSPREFASRCNLCIDVIQQALDTALGSSGNLIPDSSVAHALTHLTDLATDEGVEELIHLLTPLSRLLVDAHDSTLNQSETLLVQEAIIAATLGIDSLAGGKPMPDLVADVTARIEDVQQTTSRRLSTATSSGDVNGFLLETEELLPRLFELFQRLRGAPVGASRLNRDIHRLLHSFKQQAADAKEQQLAEIAHTLEAAMLDLSQSSAAASPAFFDTAIEAIECLDEDVERLRNSEPSVDRCDLIDRLKLERAVEDTPAPVQQAPVVRCSAPDENSASPAESDSGVFLHDRSTSARQTVDWSARFRQVEACCSAISHSHRQLLDLQQRIEQLINATNHEEALPHAESNQAMRSVAEQLQQVTQQQLTSIASLDVEVGKASMLDISLLRGQLVEALQTSAKAQGHRVHLTFEDSGVLVHQNVFDQLSTAVADLLNSIVHHAVSHHRGADSEASVSLYLEAQQQHGAITLDIVDNGCGVSVQGVKARSDNPWAQVVRADWRQSGKNRRPTVPQVFSNESQQPVNISGLLAVATRFGGTLAIRSDSEGSRYRLCLPELESKREVLIFAIEDQLMAIPTHSVDSVGCVEEGKITSIGQLIGLQRASSIKQSEELQYVAVKTKAGVQSFTVARIIGYRQLKFSVSNRVLPDLPGYEGAAVTMEFDRPVLLLDIEYWTHSQTY